MPRARQHGRPIGNRLLQYGILPGGAGMVPLRGDAWFVDTFNGAAGGAATSWDTATNTMAAALAKAKTHDHIYFVGDVREELVGSNLVFDLSIIGCGGLHHPDQQGSGSTLYDPASSCWRPPSSPTATTPLLKVRGRGWKFYNVFFDCPVDSAAIYLERNALSGTSEYDPSHAGFYGCRFVDGKYGIQDVGGCYNVTVDDCEFKAMTTCAIANTSTAVANPLNWKIKKFRSAHNVSSFGNASHIISPLNSSFIEDGFFGTVTSTAKYIDLTGGNGNTVTNNTLAGLYDTTDYVPGTGDTWYQNRTVVKATYSPDGVSIQVPGA